MTSRPIRLSSVWGTFLITILIAEATAVWCGFRDQGWNPWAAAGACLVLFLGEVLLYFASIDYARAEAAEDEIIKHYWRS